MCGGGLKALSYLRKSVVQGDMRVKDKNSGAGINKYRFPRYVFNGFNAMRARHCLCIVFAAAIFFAGCSGVSPVREPEYSDVLSEWTRSAKVFDGLDAKLSITATYKEESFSTAYLKRYLKAFKMDDNYADALFKREKDEVERYNEFFVAVYTPDESWNDLAKQNSIWRLYLEDDTGARLTPVSITQVDRDDILVREFFPYFDMWSTAYRVKFPKYSDVGAEPIPNASTNYLKLTVTGIMGEGTLEWRLKK